MLPEKIVAVCICFSAQKFKNFCKYTKDQVRSSAEMCWEVLLRPGSPALRRPASFSPLWYIHGRLRMGVKLVLLLVKSGESANQGPLRGFGPPTPSWPAINLAFWLSGTEDFISRSQRMFSFDPLESFLHCSLKQRDWLRVSFPAEHL